MHNWITGVLGSLGHAGVALLMALENLFPPIPSELIMPLAGYSSAQGELHLWLAIALGSLGAVLGTLPWYALARRLDRAKVYAWIDRHGHWLTLRREEIDRADRWFERHGNWVVAVGRLVPGVRTLISVPAGFCAMPLGRYLAWSLLGTVVWTGALGSLGYVLGKQYSTVETYVGPVTYVVFGAVLLVYVVRLVRMRRHNHARVGYF